MYPDDSHPDVSVQMYADDTGTFTHARSKEHAAAKLTDAMSKVSAG